jgi:hypothetical protein
VKRPLGTAGNFKLAALKVLEFDLWRLSVLCYFGWHGRELVESLGDLAGDGRGQ